MTGQSPVFLTGCGGDSDAQLDLGPSSIHTPFCPESVDGQFQSLLCRPNGLSGGTGRGMVGKVPEWSLRARNIPSSNLPIPP